MRRYTVAELARRLHRHPKLVYRWLAEGRLRGERYGYAWLVPERELQRFLRTQPGRRQRRNAKRSRGGR